MLIATAGHVDHGKTALVRALTGVDTDRLPEEKKRGLTIDLGFAYSAVNDERNLAFVDVPGHEKFVRNMLAGVAGIDFALLVIAADDGPKPQTHEHLAILNLLGVTQGAIALTKIDRVEQTRVDALRMEIAELLAPTQLKTSPVFALSATENIGVQELRAHLENVSAELAARSTAGHFRLAIDRSFTLHGAGLIVTGTVFSGSVNAGDRVQLLPRGLSARVRGLRVEDSEREFGVAGQRCALNLTGAGLSRADIHRGDWAVAPEQSVVTSRFDARLQVLASEDHALRHWTPVHVHLGSGSTTGRLATLADRELKPGADGLVQVVLDEPIHAVHADAFILRDQSAQRTLAGGRVLDPYAPQRGRAKHRRLAQLEAFDSITARQALERLAEHEAGINVARFAQTFNLTPVALEALLGEIPLVGIPVTDGTISLGAKQFETLSETLLQAIGKWHADRPDETGAKSQDIVKSVRSDTPDAIVAGALDVLIARGVLRRSGLSLHLPSHEARLKPEDAAFWQAVSKHLTPETLKPPVVAELSELLKMETAKLTVGLSRCARRGQLTRVVANRYFHPDAVTRLAGIVETLANESESHEFDAKSYRDASGIGRNLSIQVLEYFDTIGLTRRIGDKRRLKRVSTDA